MCFIDVSATNKIDNLTCVIYHLSLLYFCGAMGLFLYNKYNNTSMLGNMKFISRVE